MYALTCRAIALFGGSFDASSIFSRVAGSTPFSNRATVALLLCSIITSFYDLLCIVLHCIHYNITCTSRPTERREVPHTRSSRLDRTTLLAHHCSAFPRATRHPEQHSPATSCSSSARCSRSISVHSQKRAVRATWLFPFFFSMIEAAGQRVLRLSKPFFVLIIFEF